MLLVADALLQVQRRRGHRGQLDGRHVRAVPWRVRLEPECNTCLLFVNGDRFQAAMQQFFDEGGQLQLALTKARAKQLAKQGSIPSAKPAVRPPTAVSQTTINVLLPDGSLLSQSFDAK